MCAYKPELKAVWGTQDETCRLIPYVCDTRIQKCALMKISFG